MISKRKGFSLRLVILLKENYWVGGLRATRAHVSGPMFPEGFNGMSGVNIPYAKENFRMAKY